MAQFVKVGTTAEFSALTGGKMVEAGGEALALFRLDGGYYAIGNTCPHRGGPLSQGMLSGHEVTCPWHGARFDIRTGAVLCPPAQEGIKSYPVRVNGEDVEVEVG
jgi:3-phenylpropionate/trans-cinnamate dioxygenase ferredoxin subunit